MLNEPSVRDATETDAPVIAELLGGLGYSVERGFIRNRLALFASRPDEAVLVAESLGKVVGVISLHLFPLFHAELWVGRITALVIRPDQRSRGVARALLQAAENAAWGRQCIRVEIDSGGSHYTAPAFYERTGYERVDRYFVKARPR
jgi:N-acetylglutamate synthase-like GNAT family acetyltransferase